ncbi:hypothetical protein VMCG_08837 [Cytospora schulzeri]|uniref:Uncharacterized protein n=1 Tax=Cytospora schulzeri TaxID=448051 RepID=A0A423VUL1_9PEZI|nr:hypothetical protein VMCG_08837 [Valsa malicola]
MSSFAQLTARRVATVSRSAASSTFSTVPRASFTTTVQLQKNPIDTAKDGLKKVDRVVSDKLVDGINIGTDVKDKVKEAGSDVTSGKTSGQAAELRGEAKGKASELKGDAKEAAGEAKGKASELKGKAKEKVNEL